MAFSTPAQVGSETPASLAIEDPATLVMASVPRPDSFPLRKAESVSPVSPDCEMTVSAAFLCVRLER
jgi:hypothetical protein